MSHVGFRHFVTIDHALKCAIGHVGTNSSNPVDPFTYPCQQRRGRPRGNCTQAWIAECDARIDAVKSGDEPPVPWKEIHERLQAPSASPGKIVGNRERRSQRPARLANWRVTRLVPT
jgi:hypothetical protein